jgi:ribose transport system permease protein
MKKFLGIFGFLMVIYAVLLLADPTASSASNHRNLAERIGLSGVVSLGASLLIISGGIDLSIGSVAGLSATILAMLLRSTPKIPPVACFAIVLGVGVLIGLVNGLLVTKLRVQAFVVTLCGLFVYRGAARWLARDQVKGLGTEFENLTDLIYNDNILGLPRSLFYFLVLAGLAAVFLHLSVYGRYFYAIGSNERAARYSGIATDRYKILAYVICSLSAALYGCLFLMKQNSVQPSADGNFLELYAIAGAVLGGCSLRGGEGNIIGVIIGTTILVLLPNLSNMLGIPSALEYTVIGSALLLGAILDEVLRRFSAGRAAK